MSRCAASPCPVGKEGPVVELSPAPEPPGCAHTVRGVWWQEGGTRQLGPHRVDLAQDGALGEEERLAGVHHDEVEVGAPGALRGLGLPGSRVWRGGGVTRGGVTDGGGLLTAPPARPHLVPVTEVEQVGHDGLQRQPGSLPPHHPSGGQLWGGGAVLCALSPQG